MARLARYLLRHRSDVLFHAETLAQRTCWTRRARGNKMIFTTTIRHPEFVAHTCDRISLPKTMSLISRVCLIIGALFLTNTPALRADPVPLDTDALATLAVQDHGRKKPFTTFARETLLTMSGTSALPYKNDDGTKVKLSPEEVVLDLWFKPEGWDDKPVIMLNFLELKKQFGLPEDQKLFSFNQLIKQPALMQLLDDA